MPTSYLYFPLVKPQHLRKHGWQKHCTKLATQVVLVGQEGMITTIAAAAAVALQLHVTRTMVVVTMNC